MLRNTCSRENHTHTYASTATVAAGPRDTPPHWISQRDYQQTWSVNSKMGGVGEVGGSRNQEREDVDDECCTKHKNKYIQHVHDFKCDTAPLLVFGLCV